jgi:putative mycofactocin binding protein MftB
VGDEFDATAPYRLAPEGALRPEPFGALAYHYGNRRLTFLRSPEIVALVRDLEQHPSVDAALAASGIPPERWASYRAALARLSDSKVIDGR